MFVFHVFIVLHILVNVCQLNLSFFPPLPDLLSYGARSAVHNESEEMSLQQAALSLLFLPKDVY